MALWRWRNRQWTQMSPGGVGRSVVAGTSLASRSPWACGSSPRRTHRYGSSPPRDAAWDAPRDPRTAELPTKGLGFCQDGLMHLGRGLPNAGSLAVEPFGDKPSRFAVLKYALQLLGRYLPGRLALHMQALLNYILLGYWGRVNHFRIERRVRNRQQLYEFVTGRIGFRQTLYLEFGVFTGASMETWCRLLRHPQSVLHGFDTFEGMPEDFDTRTGIVKGAFNVAGKPPSIDDPRVAFVRGRFEETLPSYQVREHDQLIINIDCDLYSSTACVLKYMAPHIRPGTILIFDDMGQPQHEPRAFAEFLRERDGRFRLIAADLEDHYAFECVQEGHGA